MGEANATLDGRPLIGNVAWAVSSGVRPRTTVVTLLRSDANALLGGGGISGGAATTGSSGPRPVTLRLKSGRDGEFRNLYVLHEMPAPAPTYAALLIADRRWLWQNAIYRRHLNVRRKIGTKRLTSQNQAEAWTVDDDISYAPYSLKEGRSIWKPADLLADLGEAIKTWEQAQGGGAPTIVIPPLPEVGKGGTAIQDLELDGTLDACIERALAFLPGMDVTVDWDGSVRFFWRTGTDESAEISAAGPEVMGRGHITPVSFRRVRPRKIRVYFSVMAEIRVDVEELASTGTTFSEDQDGFWAENVLPVPDYELQTASGTVTSGTYVTFAEALSAWNTTPLPGIGALDFTKIRRAMVPFNNLWTGARLHGSASPDQDWMGRLGAIQAHYRRTFRLNRRIMDRLASIHPYRVATINPVTGTRGRAAVFSDFAYVCTTRSLFAEEQNSQQLSYAMNVATYPTDGTITATTLAAPALLTIDDSDQGIFSVDYHSDKTRVYEMALPSQIETEGQNTTPGTLVAANGGGPSPYLGRSTRSIGWNILGRFQAPATLTAQHKLIAIFTAVPASPNNKRAMCWVDVSPGEVAPWGGSNVCEGPMLEIRIGPGLEVARVGWDDTQKERIQSLLTSSVETPVAEADQYELKNLVINYESGAGNSASLTSIARAAAARVWHALRDHQVGSATFGFRPTGKIDGSLESVEHELEVSGALTSRFTVPARVEAFDLNRYLDASTQRIIHRLANPGE